MRLIDADALMKDIENERAYLINRGQIGAEHVLVHSLIPYIDDAPTIDAEPVRHGRWQKDRHTLKSGEQYIMYQCSECGASFQEVGYGWPYCPECGARMDGGAEDVDR